MDFRQISALLIKISGLVVIVFAVTGIPGYINSFLYIGNDTLVNFIMWIVIPLVFPLSIGLAMWFFPKSITNKIIKNNNESIDANKITAEIEQIAITVLGLILLFFALSDLTFNLVNIFLVNKENYGSFSLIKISAEDWGHLVGTLVELTFAIFLIVRTKGIIIIISKLRS